MGDRPLRQSIASDHVHGYSIAVPARALPGLSTHRDLGRWPMSIPEPHPPRTVGVCVPRAWQLKRVPRLPLPPAPHELDGRCRLPVAVAPHERTAKEQHHYKHACGDARRRRLPPARPHGCLGNGTQESA